MPGWADTLSIATTLSAVPAHGGGVAAVRHGDWAELVLSGIGRANAINLAMWEELAGACRQLATSSGPRAVVVRGAGKWSFSAGADIAEFPERRCTPEAAREYGGIVSDALRALVSLPIPAIAMVGGYAVGGGCEIAAACDVRVAADSARLGLPLARLGVTQGPVERDVMIRLIGSGRLKWLILSGRLLTAEEARQVGLVDEVVPVADLASRTAALVAEVLGASDPAIRAAKVMADSTGLDEPVELFNRVYGGADLRSRVGDFLNRSSAQ